MDSTPHSTGQIKHSTSHIADFLEDISILKLNEDHWSDLEKPISEAEILEVIKNLKLGSASGPVGFLDCYCKTFRSSLSTYVTRFFNSLPTGSKIDAAANMAYISVIPKPGKDSSEVSNYRPISLINNDLNILTKILANRLSTFTGGYIHKDQVGFIPGRQGPDQIRRAVDGISLLRANWDGGSPQEGSLLSVDLQKAFDTVEWLHLFERLDRWGFGPHFLQTLRALYSNSSAQVKLLGHFSDPFPKELDKGVPFPPINFAIAIETLAIAIRSNPNIHGVRYGQRTHKCVLFAEDLLLFYNLSPHLHPEYS